MHLAKTLLALFVFFTTRSLAQDGSGIIGKWKGEDKPNSHIQFYIEKDGFYYGKLVYENGKTENIGKIMMNQLKYDDATKTYKVNMTAPDKNITLKITLSLEGNNKIKVIAKKLFITKTIYFLRVQ
jgi:hypothetical protein